ncbi:MAG: hypothetical protein IT539_01425 [Bradyrhizobiaceae bacterium]|nr:hypothetical protein [Bradyrhizobiaceae bacterium]
MRLSCLADSAVQLVADASVIINLNASGCAKQILRALPNRILLTDTVLAELGRDKANGRDDGGLVTELINESLATVVALADIKQDNFEALVAGRTVETLDDGEAATIACAIEANAGALIDERKAIALCQRKYPNLLIGCTIDVLAHEAVEVELGRSPLADSVFRALQHARMRVSPHHEQWVLDLIGRDRATACPSLPSRLRAAQPDMAASGQAR